MTMRKIKVITLKGYSKTLSKNLAYLPVKPLSDFGSPDSKTKEFSKDLSFLFPRFPKIDPIAGVNINA